MLKKISCHSYLHLSKQERKDARVYIKYVCLCVCLFVGLSALDLRNGTTYEYGICTAYWCDDTNESEVLIFNYFWNKLQFTKYQSFLYISKTVNRTNVKF